MSSTGYTAGVGKGQIDYFVDKLSTLGLIDVGVITQFVNSEGKATVETFNVKAGRRIVVTGVEVLYVGSSANGLWSDCVGSPCLLFYPRAIVPSLRDRKIDPSKRPYDMSGAKCIPLSTRQNAEIGLGFDNLGNFVIQCANYTVHIGPEGMTYANRDNSVVKTLGGQEGGGDAEYGRIFTETDATHTEVYYLDNSLKCAYRFSYTYDGTYKVQRCAKTVWTQEEQDSRDAYDNWTWEEIYTNTGAYTKTLRDNNKKVLLEISEGIDGAVTITQKNASGDTLNEINLTTGGKCTVTSKNGVEVMGGEGKLKVGNDSYTLKDAFSDLISVLDHLQTAGSPANHSAVPGQFATLQGKLAGLF